MSVASPDRDPATTASAPAGAPAPAPAATAAASVDAFARIPAGDRLPAGASAVVEEVAGRPAEDVVSGPGGAERTHPVPVASFDPPPATAPGPAGGGAIAAGSPPLDPGAAVTGDDSGAMSPTPEAPPFPAPIGPYGPLPFLPGPDQQRRNARRHLLAAAGGVLAILALLASLAVGGVFDPTTTPTAAPLAEEETVGGAAKAGDKPQVTRIAAADLAGLTDSRTQALKSGNVDGFVAGIDPAATELATAQRRLFANLRLFPFTSVEFRPSTATVEPANDAGPLTRDVNVVFAHQITGVDSEPIAERYTWTVSRASVGAPLLITKIAGGSTRGGGNAFPAPWDEDELAVLERPHVLLAVPAKNKAKAAAWADRAESALKKNLAVWKGPAITPQRYVIYVTPDHETFIRALSGNDLPNVTGVCRTMPPARPTMGRDQPMAGSRITLDGSDEMFAKNDGEQQTHLIRHELGHAMVAEFERGGEGPPLWVSEGFAEYLAWTDLSLSEWFQPTAREQVRAGKFTGKLPTDADVNSPDAKTSTVSYHYSMLTIRYIAEKYGVAKADEFVVAVYKDPTPAAIDAALKQATGLDRDTFESNWAKYVKAKVGN
ncbi:hypothetical protein B4N89_23305 [Embleya scabrispora]|uniref:Peptidase MA-like domain-containing protein n=1 Tax=Embleya scabrispora TaxID=159449 RepID=A0A1T3P3E4_9ACTN|nr:hypothetical protein [Embleya scabrispora]OPC83475.1 hypothetical protein B4N89_23305 [Embleya scabrispora]